jgi:hypothetical protein
MARMTKRPVKKNVSPVVAGVVIVVVLVLIVVVYLQFGKGPTGMVVDTKEARQLVESMNKMGGGKGFRAAMDARRAKGRSRGRRRGPAPRRDEMEKQQAPGPQRLPGQ